MGARDEDAPLPDPNLFQRLHRGQGPVDTLVFGLKDWATSATFDRQKTFLVIESHYNQFLKRFGRPKIPFKFHSEHIHSQKIYSGTS